MSGPNRIFAPSWVWDVPESAEDRMQLSVRGGRRADDILIADVPVRRTLRFGYCARASLDAHWNITCLDDRPPPLPPATLRVPLIPMTPALAHLFAHHLLDAAANIGLSEPLARSAHRIEWLHTGLLDNAHVHVRRLPWLRPPRGHLVKIERVSPREDRTLLLHDFVLPLAVPPAPTEATSAAFRGFVAPPGTRQPEEQRVWLPLSAYAVPFGRGAVKTPANQPADGLSAASASDGECGPAPVTNRRTMDSQAERPTNGWRAIGLLSRAPQHVFARDLADEAEVIHALRPLLHARQLHLHVLNSSQHTPEAIRPLVGVIGVHGTAFGNVCHAPSPALARPLAQIARQMLPSLRRI